MTIPSTLNIPIIHINMNKAVEIYSRVPKTHNCAQSVAEGCDRPDLVETLKTCGGGRAPEGFCGALYAALLMNPPERHAAIREAFRKEVGSECCEEIRAARIVPCAHCIEVATEL